MMRGVWLLWVVACTADHVLEAPEPVPVEVRAWLADETGPRGGVLEIQVEATWGTEVTTQQPQATGLAFTTVNHIDERLGSRQVQTTRYRFTGNQGMHVISGLCAATPPGAPVCANPIHIDLGVTLNRAEMVDIVEPTASPQWPWSGMAMALGALTLLLGGIFIGFRQRPEPPVIHEPIESPDVTALRRWEETVGNPHLDDHERALTLSHIFRTYVEHVLQFPALSWTTSQTVEHLKKVRFIGPSDVDQATRLLRATDLIKFADRTADGDLFADLDHDLRSFIDKTRPRMWGDTIPHDRPVGTT